MNYQLSVFGAEHVIISEKDLPRIKTVLDDIDILITEKDNLDKEEEDFILTLKKNTTTPDVRLRRCKFIIKRLVKSLRM